MKREMFSSVGVPSASTLFRNLWSRVLRTSSMLRSSRPRSSTMPVTGSGVPRTVTSARNEWPWISSLSAPKVVPLRECAASKRNDLVSSHILKIWFLSDAELSDTEGLSDTKCLVCLQAEPPLRMAQAVVDCARGVFDQFGPVHRLQRKAFEIESRKIFRRGARLRIHQLQFVAAAHHQSGAGFRADADPVHPVGRFDRPVGLDTDGEAARMQRFDEGGIDLQQRLAAGQDHIAVGMLAGPLSGDGVGEFICRGVAAAERAVGADKVGVAELAGGGGAVLFAAAPQVAAGKTAKHRCAAGMRAFALQGQEYLFDRVAHTFS